jgi:hypothetical protein
MTCFSLYLTHMHASICHPLISLSRSQALVIMSAFSDCTHTNTQPQPQPHRHTDTKAHSQTQTQTRTSLFVSHFRQTSLCWGFWLQARCKQDASKMRARCKQATCNRRMSVHATNSRMSVPIQAHIRHMRWKRQPATYSLSALPLFLINSSIKSIIPE